MTFPTPPAVLDLVKRNPFNLEHPEARDLREEERFVLATERIEDALLSAARAGFASLAAKPFERTRIDTYRDAMSYMETVLSDFADCGAQEFETRAVVARRLQSVFGVPPVPLRASGGN